MSNIGQRVFVAGGNALYMTLANEEWVRTLGIGTNWTKLRIGLMVAVTPNGVSNFPASKFIVALCSGTSSPYGAASTTNCIGVNMASQSGGDATGTWTYVANAGLPYYNVAGGTNTIFKRVATTSTVGGSTQMPFTATNTGSLQRRTPIYFDILKGSPNWTITSYTWSAGNVSLDFTFGNFLEGLEVNTVPIIGTALMGGGSAATVAFNEAAGSIDTLDILWNMAAFPVEIYAIGVYRFS